MMKPEILPVLELVGLRQLKFSPAFREIADHYCRSHMTEQVVAFRWEMG